MKSFLFAALTASSLLACAVDTDTSDTEQASSTELNNVHRATPKGEARPGGGGSSNLSYHGGPVLTTAHVVPIFWGPYWGSGTGADQASSIASYLNAYGNSGEYNVITQYSFIKQSTLFGSTTSANFDSSTPPQNVTDALVQAEASKYIAANGYDASAIYEVFLPPTSYSSDGTHSTSCGGPHLAYCAYHGNFAGTGGDTKYGSMPYPGCGGCQTAGFTATQNIEHFISHETREAVTDPDLNAWFDNSGNEADDKCAWTPTPFGDANVGTNVDGSPFAFQYEWSNATSSCVKTY
jgi:hypothetical protein